MLTSTLYFKHVKCPFDVGGLCKRPHCHLKHDVSQVTNKPLHFRPKPKEPKYSTIAPSYSTAPSQLSTPAPSLSREIDDDDPGPALDGIGANTNATRSPAFTPPREPEEQSHVPVAAVAYSALLQPTSTSSYHRRPRPASPPAEYRPTPIGVLQSMNSSHQPLLNSPFNQSEDENENENEERKTLAGKDESALDLLQKFGVSEDPALSAEDYKRRKSEEKAKARRKSSSSSDSKEKSKESEKPVTPVKPEKRELTEVDLFTPVTKQAQDLFGGKDVDSDAETETGDYDRNEEDEEVTASDLPVTCEDAPVTSPIRCSCNECSKALKSMLGKDDNEDYTESFLKLMDDLDKRLGIIASPKSSSKSEGKSSSKSEGKSSSKSEGKSSSKSSSRVKYESNSSSSKSSSKSSRTKSSSNSSENKSSSKDSRFSSSKSSSHRHNRSPVGCHDDERTIASPSFIDERGNDNFEDDGTFAEPLPPSLPSSPQLPDLPDFDDDLGDGDGENDDDLEGLFESIQPVAKETAKADPSKRRLNQAEEAEDIDDQSGPSNSRKRVARTENSYREVPTKRLKPTPSQVMMERFNKAKASRALPAGGSSSTSSSTPSSSSASSKDSRRGPSKKPEPVKYNPMAKVSFSGLKKVGEASRQAHTFKEEKVSADVPVLPEQCATSAVTNVSFAMRQTYLKQIHKECQLLFRKSPTEARTEAVANEKRCFMESGQRKAGYINLVVKTIQGLRNRKKQEAEKSSGTNGHPRANMTVTHLEVLAGKKGTIGTWSMEKSKAKHAATEDIPDAQFYEILARYALTKEQLEENGYPVFASTLSEPDGKEYKPGEVVFKDDRPRNPQPADKSKRRCDRCGRTYSVDEDGLQTNEEECVYHWGRKYRMRGSRATGPVHQYSCCSATADADGCQVSSCHFAEMRGADSRLGFVSTMPPPGSEEVSDAGVFALDCEMCSTTLGNELTRVTVVNLRGQTVYESLVMPDNPIIDYNTRFSGITEDQLKGVTTKLRDVQAVLLCKFSSETILIGHSLESDLKVLKLVHSKVVDTSVVFPHKLGPPLKRALRTLAAEHLKRIIQEAVDGHDSAEDAIAALDLMKVKVRQDYIKLVTSAASKKAKG